MLRHKVKSHPFITLLVILFFTSTQGLAQTKEWFLKAKDGRTGNEIKASFKVKTMPNGFDVPVTAVGSQLSIKVPEGERLKIVASATGYYTNEQLLLLDDSIDGDVLSITLEQRPFSNLTLDVVDTKTGKRLDASVELFLKDKSKGSFKLSGTPLDVPIYEPGEYRLVASAAGYLPADEFESYAVETPSLKYKKTFSLAKENDKVEILLADARSGAAVQVARVNYLADGTISASSQAGGGKFVLDQSQAPTSEVHIMADGYFTAKKILSGLANGGKVALTPLPIYKIVVKDGISNTPVAAELEISLKNGQPQKLMVAAGQTGSYQPKNDGEIFIKTTVPGFTPYAYYHAQNESKSTLEVLLEKSTRTYQVLAVAEGNAPVKAAILRVLDMEKQEIQKLSSLNGEFSVTLPKDKAYKLVLDAEGYSVAEKTIVTSEPTLIRVPLSRKMLSYKITVVDGVTKKPIPKVAVSGTKNGLKFEDEADEFGVYNFEKAADDELAFTLDASNYKPEKQLITSESKAEFVVEMTKSFVPIELVVLSARDGAYLPKALIKVLNKNTGKTIEPDDAKMHKYAFNSQHAFEVTVTHPDFESRTLSLLGNELLTANAIKWEIKLSPKASVSHLIEVLDMETGQKVATATVEGFTQAGDKYTGIKKESGWQLDVKNYVPYMVKVTAPMMEEAFMEVKDFEKFTHTISLKKRALTTLYFELFDEVLKQVVPGKYVVKDDKGKEIPVNFKESKVFARLLNDAPYTVWAEAAGYPENQKKIEWPQEEGAVIRIPAKKGTYAFTLFVKNLDNKLLVADPKAELVINNEKPLPLSDFSKSKGSFTVNLPVNSRVKVSVLVEGYEPRTETYTFSELAEAGLLKTLLMKPLPEPVKTVMETPVAAAPKKPTETKLEVKPVEVKPVELPKPEPKKAPTVFEQNALDLVDLPDGVEGIKEALLRPDARTKKFVLTKVYFEQGKPLMQAASDAQLNQVYEVLKSNEKLAILLVGHTDDGGDRRQNNYLSELRAKVVSSYLFNKGIADARITTKGEGQNLPIAPNDTEEHRAKNRRVELIVISNE